MQSEVLFRHLGAKLTNRGIKIQNEADYLAAAVVLPLVHQVDGLAVLFEVRSGKLAWQPGDICFPGGRIEAVDGNPAAAAIRETGEELGIGPSRLKLLGELDCLVSPIGVVLYPFVGCIAEAERVIPNRDEVAEIFTVPLDYLLQHEPQVARMEVATRPLAGFPLEYLPEGYPQDWRQRSTYSVLFYRYRQYTIWGLTARVLYEFLNLCRDVPID